jgi:hypothetical protein
MTDQVTAAQDNSTAPQSLTPPQPLSPEQFETIKNSLLQNVQQSYSTFVSFLAKIPAHQQMMQEAFRFFDTGVLWMEKAVIGMPMPQAQVIQAPVTPEAAPASTEFFPPIPPPAA